MVENGKTKKTRGTVVIMDYFCKIITKLINA